MSRPWLTPAQARDLAGEAERLAERLEAVEVARSADPDHQRQRAGDRLTPIPGELHRAALALLATADHLARLASRPQEPCLVSSGACPEHGGTLAESEGEARCTAPGCKRHWSWRRLTMPCTEPVAFHVTLDTGASGAVCAGHAVKARQSGASAVVALRESAGE